MRPPLACCRSRPSPAAGRRGPARAIRGRALRRAGGAAPPPGGGKKKSRKGRRRSPPSPRPAGAAGVCSAPPAHPLRAQPGRLNGGVPGVPLPGALSGVGGKNVFLCGEMSVGCPEVWAGERRYGGSWRKKGRESKKVNSS